MRIAIIGTGRLGAALGAGWARAGHDVVFGSRDPRSEKVAAAVRAAGRQAGAAPVTDAAAGAEAVAFATPWSAVHAVADAIGPLQGRTVIDCTNPLNADFSGLTVANGTSAAETIQGWLPAAKVVKAFNTLGAQNVGKPRFHDQPATMFYCGDDGAAKQVVAGLGGDLGLEMVDAGPLVRARLLEPLGLLWISLAKLQGLGPDVAFKLLRR